ncbi:uncharacterized protein LOC101852515 [Aplysia californica]|uniref:Uncharacterized protein LOC101852515 n=1 Tax=Aplysia californica TaxID=6500 RepID=A0ABM0K7A2_APLCA|nr:uncharacterized protein LOC101852515 [Aplysia californica]
MYSQVIVLVCLLVATCHGFFVPPGYGGNRRPAICPLPSKPCRLQITMRHLNGTAAGEMETAPCTCNGRVECPSDWNDRNHVISRNLISTTSIMTLNMMFCRPIQPPNYCSLGQEALVVSGAMTIPNNVEDFNCRCYGDSPLYLHNRRYAENHLIYHTYVCDYHKPTCPNYVTRCMVMREDSVDYTCKCAQGLHCRPQEDDWTYPMYGYCRP